MQFPIVSVFLAVSLDGFIAGERGDLSWLAACAAESTAATGYDALMDSVDTLLIGRTTYDTVLTFDAWPYGDKRVVVATHRPIEARHGEQARCGDLRHILKDLHGEGARNVYLDGGTLVRQAIDARLVSSFTLSFIPVVLGRGVRLFQGERDRIDWQLVATRSFASGMVQCRYTPAQAAPG